jgi:UDP-N-acetylmuramyl pentapeptide phosphotransferase/UDP-N-acetylglucosamine-1-phosphate transferase
MGIPDYILNIKAIHKFGIQIIAAIILVIWGEVRLTGLYGILSINAIPYLASVLLSIITIVVITNAFNLIDGINGLNGSIGIVISLTFGTWLYLGGELQLALLAFSLAGALVGFLRYNFTPARIFMGDTGSLLVGYIASILAINFIELNDQMPPHLQVSCLPSVAIGILIVPLYDTFQVVMIRIWQGRSPFSSDQNHIHHRFIRLGLTHIQTTFLLTIQNIIFIFIAIWLQKFEMVGTLDLLLILFASAFILMLIPHALLKRKQKRNNKF